MKPNNMNHLPCVDRAATTQTLGATCREFFNRLNSAKAAVLAEFRERLQHHEQLLRRALSEAEALAWQTPYPHLVFPALATEKAQAIADWSMHQRSVRRVSREHLRQLAHRR
jgi:hypothetical protein